eukprot:s543_g2.t1
MKDFYATAGQQMLMMLACDRIIFKSRAIALLIQSEYRNSIVPLMLVMLASQPKFKESLAAIADDQRFQCTVKFMLMTPRCKADAERRCAIDADDAGCIGQVETRAVQLMLLMRASGPPGRYGEENHAPDADDARFLWNFRSSIAQLMLMMCGAGAKCKQNREAYADDQSEQTCVQLMLMICDAGGISRQASCS